MATMSQAGIYGIGNGILMPKLKNRFRVTFVNIGGAASTGTNISMQVTNVSRPNLSFEEVAIHRYNSVAYVAGKHSWEPCSITVEDDITNLASTVVAAQLEKQQRLIGATGKWLNSEGTASNYKFVTVIDLLDGNETVTETWKLEGCYLASVDYGENDYSASEASTMTLSIRFDHARQTLGSSVTGSAVGGLAA
jgi:hypothetical protein